jgi:alpha,alpha-trehalose-phosphate synthase [UDP-forming]
MRITVRLIVSLLFVIATVAIVFSFHQARTEKNRLMGELEGRAIVSAEIIQESVSPLVEANQISRLSRLVQRIGNRERLKGIVVYDGQSNILASTKDLQAKLSGPFPDALIAAQEGRPTSGSLKISGEALYIYALPLIEENRTIGILVLFYDTSHIDSRLKGIWEHNLLRFVTLSILIVAITLLVVKWGITGPIAQMAEWMRELRTGREKSSQGVLTSRGDILAPLTSEVKQLAKSLAVARLRAEEEARLRTQAEALWTSSRLREQMRVELVGKRLFMVSNREPYMHVREGRDVKCLIPAGGLISALDPVMRICDGVWIAHGAGNADREVVDKNDQLRVPPEEPAYTLKRIWLNKEEEDGYYYRFSNEGLWPLCHITHTRPTFQLKDWITYQRVNQKFAKALLKEIADEDSPLILIQDYHLTLLPLIVKESRPDARVSLFWHIPWPNPETYSICPWREELLLGMLGADIIGFHTQYYCNNFLETVDRLLESKSDWEQFIVERGGHATQIRPFPISVDFESARLYGIAGHQTKDSLREQLLRELGLHAACLGIGVDRIDYTKGIPERCRSIERFLEKYPEYVGKFTFVELGAPSRTHIKRYHDLIMEVEEEVDRINWRFKSKEWMPIVFLKGHHSHEEIIPFYKAADVCMVTSLHDGMNLVAKEFVASRDDEDGVLVLSQFTGASRELREAVMVNPYDIEEMADAIHASLTMKTLERSERMKRMRETVREWNIYLWASNLISSLARLRPSNISH